jgi:hypothetical protein
MAMPMPFENFDHVLYMQIRVANLYRKARQMSIDDFLKLDRETDLLSFIAVAYESFHLTGDPGILEEVDDYARGGDFGLTSRLSA